MMTPGSHVLICTGLDDPLVPPESVRELEEELKQSKVESWSIATYGKTIHAFTSPNHEKSNGIIGFEPNAARRAWVSAFDLFAQTFNILNPAPIPHELWVNEEPYSSVSHL